MSKFYIIPTPHQTLRSKFKPNKTQIHKIKQITKNPKQKTPNANKQHQIPLQTWNKVKTPCNAPISQPPLIKQQVKTNTQKHSNKQASSAKVTIPTTITYNQKLKQPNQKHKPNTKCPQISHPTKKPKFKSNTN